MDWTVRQASFGDADRLALVGGATFLETFSGLLEGDAIVSHCLREHSSSAYQKYMAAGAQAWLVEASLTGAPVGFSLVGSTDLPGSNADGSDVELKRIYMLSKFHGAGAGLALMNLALDYAQLHGFKRLLLGVYSKNARARDFYSKHGFVEIAERQFQVGDRFYDDVVLARSLQSTEVSARFRGKATSK